MANYKVYTSTGLQTLSTICSINGCSKSSLITLNRQTYGNSYTTLGQYLQSLDLQGQMIPAGIGIRIPVPLTGGVNTQYSAHADLSALSTTITGSDTKYNATPLRNLAMKPTTSKTGNSHSILSGRAGNYTTGKDFNCFVSVLLNGLNQGAWSIPVYPQEFSDTNTPSFASQNLLGRSVDYQIYNGSSRSVSFVLNLHEELCTDYTYIHSLVAYIESAAYPGYSSGIVQVPEIMFNIGSQFRTRGILESCTATWKAPIVNGKMVNCDLSIGVHETYGPYSQSQVKSMGGYRKL